MHLKHTDILRKQTTMTLRPDQKKHVFKLALFLGLVALAYGLYDTFGPKTDAEPGPPPPTEVSALTLKTETVQMYKDLPSRINAYKVADIRPQASGIITERLFEEGADVVEGQPLYQIDPAPYQAVYDSAFAALNRTKTNAKSIQAKANRNTKLLKARAVSQQAYEDAMAALDQAKADVAVAEASVAAAQVSLNYTQVYAPISGRIGKSSVTRGALVTTNQVAPLATITQLDPIYVDLIMPSRDLKRLRPQFEAAQKLAVSLFDEDGNALSSSDGELQFSEVTVNQTTGTVLMRALFANTDQTLLPGMFVRAKIRLAPVQALLVPQSAAVRGANGKLSVWVIDQDGVVKPQPIEANEAINHHWLIKGGVESGALIVTQGFQRIRPGATVKAVFEAASKSDQAE